MNRGRGAAAVGVRRIVRRAAAGMTIAVACTLTGAALAAPAQAVPLPGVDCKEAPVPEIPGRGVVGFFDRGPAQPPPAADPFAQNPTTTIYEQYGYAGLRFNTYDLGCGPDVARSPDATVGTSLANWIMVLPKTAVAATGAVLGATYDPSFLSVFDPLVEQVVDALRRTVYDQWVLTVLSAVGFLIVWRARRSAMSSTAAAIGWAMFVMILATLVFRWPLEAGRAADSTVTTTLGAVTGGLNGRGPGGAATAPVEATAGLHQALLYQTWLGGTFGDANSEVARRYGPQIFAAQALTWRQAQVLRADPAQGQKIIEAKQGAFKATAAKVAAEDPDAYEYLVGRRSESRVGYSLLAMLAAACAVPFLLLSGMLVIGALIVVRFAVMVFPAVATLGLFPPMRGLVVGVGNTVAAAVVNALAFGIGTAVMVRGLAVLLDPATGLAPWLVILLVLLLTIVMWVALTPFRRLTRFARRDDGDFARAAGGVASVGRSTVRAGGRVVTTTLGTFLGGSAAARRGDDHDDDPTSPREDEPSASPQRVEGLGAAPDRQVDEPPPAAKPPAGVTGPAMGGPDRAAARANGRSSPGPAGTTPGRPEGSPAGAAAGSAGNSRADAPRAGSGRSGGRRADEVDLRTDGDLLAAHGSDRTRSTRFEGGARGDGWRPAAAASDGVPRPVEPGSIDEDQVVVIYHPDRDGHRGVDGAA